MNEKYLEAVELIVSAARYKMALNSHKGDIELIPPDICVDMAKAELDEFLEALDKQDWDASIVELGDAFNFIIALAYNATDGYRKRKHEPKRA